MLIRLFARFSLHAVRSGTHCLRVSHRNNDNRTHVSKPTAFLVHQHFDCVRSSLFKVKVYLALNTNENHENVSSFEHFIGTYQLDEILERKRKRLKRDT